MLRLPIRRRTLTRSPGRKPRAGTKLAPGSLAYGCRRPGWRPLRDPLTPSTWMSRACGPRMLICVAGEASGVPGCGDSAAGGSADRDADARAAGPDADGAAAGPDAEATAAPASAIGTAMSAKRFGKRRI